MTSKNCHLIEQVKQLKIGFIGAGNMAQAIIHGLIKAGQPSNHIFCSNPSAGKLEQLQQQYSSINVSHDNTEVANNSDILLVSVKPQKISIALSSIKDIDLSNKLIISVAAGVETHTIEQILEQEIPIVRSMPNTPAMIGAGATGLFANSKVTVIQKQLASNIFEAVGISAWITDETQMDLVTAVSGSGPAHYFYFIESVINSAVSQGMDEQTAKQLAVQTALGAAQMVIQNDKLSVEELRNQVTSPGGTTAAAIESFQNDDLTAIIDKAIRASVQRGVELSRISKQS